MFKHSPRGCARVSRSMLAIAIALALPATAALAQDAGAEDEVANNNPVQLDSVPVTAQRRSEDIKDVPISITALSGEKLDIIGSGGDDIRVLAGRVPSLNIESSFGRAFPRFYIRGLGNTDFDLNASQPVSLIYDDIVQENPILKGFPMFDLDQIEVLRGPQGTLFGRNTPAGVVKLDSAKPTQETEGYGQISYGRFNAVNFEGALSGGLTPVVSGRISALYQRRDDYVDNTFTGEKDALEGFDETAVRAQLLFEPSDDFYALANVHLRHLDGTARLFRANIIRPGIGDLVSGFKRSEVAIDGANDQELDTYGASLKMRWNLGSMNLYSITGYENAEVISRGDVDGGFGGVFQGAPSSGPGFLPFSAESADGLPSHEQITQEFRLESNEWGRFDWQAGLYYFYEDITVDSFNFDTLAPGRPQNGFARQTQENNAWAVFASGDYDITDQLKFRGGVRYTSDDKNFTAERTVSPFGAPPTGIIAANPNDTDLSWDASLVWASSENVSYFGRVARGYRAPSVQGRLLFGDTISVAKSESVISYEAGIKTQLLDNRLRASFTVFHFDMDDQQLTAVGGATNFNRLVNANRTTGEGFEFDLEAYITDNLLVTFGASRNDTEIHDRNLATQICGAPAGCTVLDPTIVVDVNGTPQTLALLDGNRLPQAPEWVTNMTARYSIPMGDDAEIFFYTDWAYRSEVNFFLYNSPEFTGAPLLEGGLRTGYNWDYGKYEVAVFGRNILNEKEVVGGIDFNNLTGFVNEPAFYGIEFTARF
ncbi:MAG: TonB-dependent receptor [Gammaproteobacteria bacterium HGW-Gammaproteobacteria-2]|nr:MAG: TonB-dependent receptor [Gammaproteobacteria bacterium HGW-Gammaproteobacteria-2]